MSRTLLPTPHDCGVFTLNITDDREPSVKLANGMTLINSTMPGIQFDGGVLDVHPQRVDVRLDDGQALTFQFERGQWFQLTDDAQAEPGHHSSAALGLAVVTAVIVAVAWYISTAM